jgi:hypothetical protein
LVSKSRYLRLGMHLADNVLEPISHFVHLTLRPARGHAEGP